MSSVAIGSSMDDVAERIVREIGLGRARGISRLTGGVVNHVYKVDLHPRPLALRFNRDCLDVFLKERWAMQKAAAAGVLVPAVKEIGVALGYTYMLMTFEEGEVLAAHTRNLDGLFFELGRQVRKINDIEVEGFGYHLDMTGPDRRFTLSWQEAFAGEQAMIFGKDACVAMGALSRSESDLCKRFIEARGLWKPSPRLCHCDLNLNNVLVRRGGRLVVLDWTQVKGGVAPFFDLAAHSMREDDCFAALFKGYGLSVDEALVYTSDFHRVRLTDTMRAAAWAHSVNHAEMGRFKRDVQDVFARVIFS